MSNIVQLVDGAAVDPHEALLAELNELYAVVTTGAEVHIMTLQEDPPIFYAQDDFRLLLAGRFVATDRAASPLGASQNGWPA